MSKHTMLLGWIRALHRNDNLLHLEWFTPYLTYFSPRLDMVYGRGGLGQPFEGCRKKFCYPLQKGPHFANLPVHSLKLTHTH